MNRPEDQSQKRREQVFPVCEDEPRTGLARDITSVPRMRMNRRNSFYNEGYVCSRVGMNRLGQAAG